ncbi:SAP domain-containing protein [Saccharopolyspora sp. 6V]|uniref:SAP domain-containing protein n=1 Tax=Saccharopolyspora sp. 6V TaxID=2877239 RepID=UPI001CD6216E|nr:SAP domain-containing protein [Saccharopolyspora sp. 6V]MCA1191627.1 SAP domain-containing protein [Saccharopolyspora sp. 6V]
MRVRLTKHGRDTEYRDVTDTEAQWLIQRGYAVDADDGHQASEPKDEGSGSGDAGDLAGANLAELQAKADGLGLPTYGTKAQVRERIREHLTGSDSSE